MATYEITIEIISRLTRRVSANSTAEAEQQADEMYQAYQHGQKSDVITTERHQSVKWVTNQQFAPGT